MIFVITPIISAGKKEIGWRAVCEEEDIHLEAATLIGIQGLVKNKYPDAKTTVKLNESK